MNNETEQDTNPATPRLDAEQRAYRDEKIAAECQEMLKEISDYRAAKNGL